MQHSDLKNKLSTQWLLIASMTGMEKEDTTLRIVSYRVKVIMPNGSSLMIQEQLQFRKRKPYSSIITIPIKNCFSLFTSCKILLLNAKILFYNGYSSQYNRLIKRNIKFLKIKSFRQEKTTKPWSTFSSREIKRQIKNRSSICSAKGEFTLKFSKLQGKTKDIGFKF